jgi:hypothetical protein
MEESRFSFKEGCSRFDSDSETLTLLGAQFVSPQFMNSTQATCCNSSNVLVMTAQSNAVRIGQQVLSVVQEIESNTFPS